MGMSAPYTKDAAGAIRPEGGGGQYGGNSGGFDQLGFTTLTHSLDPIASGALPGQLRAHVKGGKITLSWRGSAYAKSYNVKRATTSGGPYINLATVDARNTCFMDAGVPSGMTCYYVVSANNPDGESAHSAEIYATHDQQLYGSIIGTDGSWNNAGLRKENVFDGSLKNFFDAPTAAGWVGLDLGEGVSAVITAVKYCPRDGQSWRVVGGKFQGSNTADFSSGVVDLFIINTEPPYGQLTTRSISNPNSFRYVRYLGPGNAYCNAAEVQFIGSVTGMTPPAAAPTGLAVSSPGSGQAALTWNSVSGATDFVIKRSTTSGGPYTVVEYSGFWDTNYTERKLAAGTYYYVVSALNSVGETADSSEQSVQILLNVAPGSTTSAHAGSGGTTEGSDKAVDGNVSTKWYSGGNTSSSGWLQVDLGAGNAQIVARYDFTSANDVPGRDPKDWQVLGSNDAVNWTTLDTRTGETFATRFLTRQYAISNSAAYRYYKLIILSNFSGSAVEGIQLSEWALISQGAAQPSPSDMTPPAAPTGFTATAGDHAVTLDWADNTEPDVARYTVYRSTTGGGPYSAIVTGVTFSSYSDTTVINGTTYHYVVTATDTSLNQSANSAQVSGTPQLPPPPDAPTGLAATAVSSSRIDLTWNAVNGASSYTVKRSTASGGPYATLAANLTTTTCSDTSFSPGTAYYYIVVGVNSAGEGTISSEASMWINDLQLRLKFDETGGTTAADSSGNSRNATLINGPTFAPGKIGNALVFAASSSQYATLPTGLVSTLNDFTISTWVKPTSLDNWARVFDFGSGTATNMFFAPQNGENGKPRFAIKISNSAEQMIDGASALSAGVWTHVAVTLSGSTATLYINGVAVGTNNAMTFKPSGMGSTTQNYLGKSQYADPYFNGAIDDLRIYRRALSATEITDLYAPPVITSATTATGISGSAFTCQITASHSPVSYGAGGLPSGLDINTGSGLISGTPTVTGIFEATITAANANGTGSAGLTITVLPPTPAAPGGLVATGGASAVTLTWNTVAGATHYAVWRSLTSGTGYEPLDGGTTETANYDDTGLADGTTYYYVVRAVNSGGTSGNSSEAGATTHAAVESWRLANFGTIQNSGDAADTADPDGDGSANAQEFAAGTDPNDRASVLKVSQMQASGNDMVVSFPTVVEKTYRVERSDTLQVGSWAVVLDNIAGTGGVIQVTDAGGAALPRRFYRIILNQ
jgi:fibronectin type 3 domain-containing protein